MSALEDALLLQIKALGLPEPEREYRFRPGRRWRFDLAWPGLRTAVEVEGGVWSGGRHTRGAGFERDCEKYNAATLAGWRVLRFTGGMIERGEAVQVIEQALRGDDHVENQREADAGLVELYPGLGQTRTRKMVQAAVVQSPQTRLARSARARADEY